MVTTPHFDQLPPEVIKSIIHYVAGCTASLAVLDSKSLERLKYAHGLCSNSSYMYNVFRSSFDFLFVTDRLIVKPGAVARLFGAHVRHLTITIRSCHALLLLNLAEQKPALVSLSVRFESMFQSTVCTDAVADIIKSSGCTLQSLCIQGLSQDGRAFITEIAPCIRNVQELSIGYSGTLQHSELLLLISAPGSRLKHLTISGIAQTSIADHTLDCISHVCPGLTNITLDRFWFCTVEAARSFAMNYGSRLQSFEYVSSLRGWSPDGLTCDLLQITTACPHLQHVSIDSKVCPADVIRALSYCAKTLCSITIMQLDSLELADIAALKVSLPNLERIQVRALSTLQTLSALCSEFGPQLRNFQLRTYNLEPSDEMFIILTALSGLRILELELITFAKEIVSEQCTSMGFDSMMQAIGKELVAFSWSNSQGTPILGSNFPPNAAYFSSAAVARSLRVHCKKLRLLYMRGFKPIAGKCEDKYQIFEELEKRSPPVALYLDRGLPYKFERMIYKTLFSTL